MEGQGEEGGQRRNNGVMRSTEEVVERGRMMG